MVDKSRPPPTHASVEIGAYKVEYVRDAVVLFENGEAKLTMLAGEAAIIEELLRRLREDREHRTGGKP